MRAIKTYPHCDSNVLHKPGDCTYCDMHPEWQELRATWGINYTGEEDPAKSPCPSSRFRSVEIINEWSGNRPRKDP
jgi:hypothetical protein